MAMTMKDLTKKVQITMDYADAERLFAALAKRRELNRTERRLFDLLNEYTNT